MYMSMVILWALSCSLFYGVISNSDHTAPNGIRLAHFTGTYPELPVKEIT